MCCHIKHNIDLGVGQYGKYRLRKRPQLRLGLSHSLYLSYWLPPWAILCNCSCMGVYMLWKISWTNYDSSRGAKPRGHNHNFWVIFLVAHTCPYINEFITQGNRKLNADRDADGLLSSPLPLTRSDIALSRSLSTTYEMRKPWDKRRRTTHLDRLVSNSLQQHSVQEPRCHFTYVRMCYERNRPCYEHDRPCYEHHASVTSVMPCYKPVTCGYPK